MTTPPHHDDELFAALKMASASVLGPPSEHDVQLAQRARDLVAAAGAYDPAELEYDSLVHAAPAVRAAALRGARELEFHAENTTVHVEVTPELLRCRVEPVERATVNLSTAGGAHHELSPVGGSVFELLDPPSGMVRLEIQSAEMQVATRWIRL